MLEAMLHLDRRPNIFLRFADRYLGIPLVAILGLLRRKKTDVPKTIRSIGVLGNAAIGDSVISSSALMDIRDALPDAKIVFFAPGADSAAIGSMISGLDFVVPIRLVNPFETVRTIRRYGPFDLWFDLGPWPRANAVISFFTPSSLLVGFETPGQSRHAVYDRTAKHANDVHEVENYRRLLAVAGIHGSHLPRLKPPAAESPGAPVVMQIRSGGTAAAMKMWPEENWIALIGHVTRTGRSVVLTGSDRDREYLDAIRARSESPDAIENVAGRLSLVEIARLLVSSAAVVSVDTGLMHMAAALDCRLVALFGATSPRRWGPLNPRARILYSARDCSPCVSLGLEAGCDRNRCMEEISAKAVMQELDTLMRHISEEMERTE